MLKGPLCDGNQLQKGPLSKGCHPYDLVHCFVLQIFAAIYIVSPIDLIPDLLGPVGLVDDVGVFLLTQIVISEAMRSTFCFAELGGCPTCDNVMQACDSNAQKGFSSIC